MLDNKLLTRVINRYSFHGINSFEVINPATDELICKLEAKDTEYIQKSINSSKQAQNSSRQQLATERSKLLSRWYDLIVKNADELAQIITLESGKPLTEAKSEILYGANFIQWYAEKAKRIDSRIFEPNFGNVEGRVDYQPVGVVAAITPWNFPIAMVTRKVAPAIAAGCSVILKPSALTPLTAFAVRELLIDTSADENLLQVICGDSSIIGKEFQHSSIIRKITFTGSTKVGKLLMQQAAETVKKVSLELGGNAPFIVFESANLEKAVEGLIAAKIRNAGQVCVAPNRVFVQKNIKAEFMSKLKKAIAKLKQGNGLDNDVQIGPLINESAVEKVQVHIADAVSKGAKIVYGGQINPKLGGKFFEPTILDNMTDQMVASCEETFGPVITIFDFDTEKEVLEKANNTNYGLASYFFSNDINQIRRVRIALEYGMIGINTGLISNEKAPFGGIKESGLGREGSDEGIYEFLEAKYSMQSFA
ncbi:succinate-semialdehyde dehydrogenase/glutarate-semialdehyde dehydrogenase [Allofrancisella inopinata]|uniref:Aldehyde dehydrogenase n=1 Tax=Allofrancisella inopinata TaxID=1085647 RepID=A0AAE6YJ56_9GAMM|nr:NAD-dependent succinate-semialdehyde dehydrogenase [Allofrancisella inopinata]QIV96683.1 NAD-dependent succinate-semialdehyde dehydrogenase [Allofrancisella inopinata]TDT73435.1 succinate-semialdehyde dehydrogenase/glutarate-semialdehyde dehydrogenase [Allofrancisella inopinata]